MPPTRTTPTATPPHATSSVSMVDQLAGFATRASWTDLSAAAVAQLKNRVLDSIGCAVGALDAEPVQLLGRVDDEFGGRELATVIGRGRSAPDRAARFNGALVRYLDFNDSYLAPGETCHPSDNLGAVLAATEYAGGTGRDLLTALAVAYQVQCRLSDEAPVRARGFDHTTHGVQAAAAGVARALGVDARHAANAIAIAATAHNALRVTRTGALSHWKGLAAPEAAAAATHAAFLAAAGITGPPAVYEGNKGFIDTIAGPFTIDWDQEDLERVRRTILKKFNAEIHSQSAIEALLQLRSEHALAPSQVDRIELEVFDVAHDIIGGGEEGDKTHVRTKEQADHSLPYLLAVALADGQVLPAQYRPRRITSGDVQALLRRVEIRPADDLTARFPDEHACRLAVHLHDGRTLRAARADYEGFHTRPMSFGQVADKARRLGSGHIDGAQLAEIIDAVDHLDQIDVHELTRLLATVHPDQGAGHG